VTIHAGRIVADQAVADFARTRFRPRVAVRTPHAARLAGVLGREARAARRSVEVVAESGSLLSVYGSNCAEIGETAFRHGVLVHRPTDEVGDTRPSSAAGRSPTTAVSDAVADSGPEAVSASGSVPGRRTGRACTAPRPQPVRPLCYELRRMLGTRTAPLAAVAALAASLALCVLLARTRPVLEPSVFAAWPPFLPLPPAALCAGLVGALSFGEEFRYRSSPRRAARCPAALPCCRPSSP
jgi:hypothetical protein